MFLRSDSLTDLFRQVNRLQSDMGRAFSRRGSAAGFASAGPAVNIWEDTNQVVAEFDLPGVNAETLNVSVIEGNQLTIQGERVARELPGSVWHRQERLFGGFSRTVTLPTLVNADQVQATYEAGVLKLVMPKADAAKPRQITVKTV